MSGSGSAPQLDERLRWVGQKDAEGCGVAVLAMLTGEDYDTIKTRIDSQDFHGHDGDWANHGLTHISLDRELAAHGFFQQRVYEAWGLSEWPPDPWAPVHYAQVVQPSGNAHFVVMDVDGVVLDPMREGTFRLADWEKVNNVVGLLAASPGAEGEGEIIEKRPWPDGEPVRRWRVIPLGHDDPWFPEDGESEE